MKRRNVRVVAASLVIGAVLVGSAGIAFAGTSRAVPGFGWMMGGSGASRMMNGSGYQRIMNGTGPYGMMSSPGSGDMMGSHGPTGMMGGWSQPNPSGTPLSIEQARQSVQRYIDQLGDSNLTIDEVIEFQRNFYAVVKDTSTGHGAFELLVNKATGAVSLEVGPAMMWNTEYGMMSGTMGFRQPSGPMTVSAAEAQQIAQQWLKRHESGATIEAPDQFPGYYTIHFLQNGKIAGMLSVNGYTGQVWYHSWHGKAIRVLEFSG